MKTLLLLAESSLNSFATLIDDASGRPLRVLKWGSLKCGRRRLISTQDA